MITAKTRNLDDVIAKLESIKKKQTPFAASQALNDTAFKASKELKRQAAKKLDRPTKFTLNAFQVKRATKSKLTARVFVEDKRAGYLVYAIEGGRRDTSGRGTGVPVNQPLNKFGNIPGRRKGLLKKKNQFIATIHGTSGVWERVTKSRIKLITAFHREVNYDAIFPFHKIVQGVYKNTFKSAFKKRLIDAIRTAK